MSIAVVGGQFGSEGKGLILSRVGKDYDCHVRVGAANAGHTMYDFAYGEKRVLQQIPCGAYSNPNAELYIGPGALISPDIFLDERERWATWRARVGLGPKPVYVDYRAHVIRPYHRHQEASSDLADRIGSTSATAREGIGPAQASRVLRDIGCLQAGDFAWNPTGDVRLVDVPKEIYGRDVLLEGTQGAGLSLTTGYFPYVTSRNATVAGLCADCGFDPRALKRVILVIRTFPIRVAGNSGPFAPGSREITWDQIGVDPDTEKTTVTKKVRRVATFSIRQVKEAVILNGPTEIALNFCDYVAPPLKGFYGDFSTCPPLIDGWVENIERETGVPVRWLGTGPNSVIHLRDRGDA